ncbi:TPA: hypothetical protein ACXM9H_000973 [Burkholderia multivorans]|uniref:hypothetical protein n=1 Tax=Burkholderia multivorans TaxID=87883 RepID=UPI000CFF04FD|nr:hypothetical protein [Burkholderia multivorans]PRD74789.1 hypothetical protein C6P75_12425 [Burkholderia multivorans]
MARIRSIKPEYWTSEQVMNCSRDARCLFIGLWNFCDDGGNHPASVKTLKAEVFPGDDDATMDAMMRWIDELIEQGLLAEYEAEGREFWHVTGWHHQRIDQPTMRHPVGDAGDAVTQGDARHPKRLGGKQRQLLIRKLRDRDGDTCHSCGDAPGVTLLRVTEPSPENPHDARTYRLVCTSCRGKKPAGDAQVTQGDARYVAGDSTTESNGVESNGVEGSNTTGTVIVSGTPSRVTGDASPDDDLVPRDNAEWIRYFAERHGVEIDPMNLHERKKAFPLFAAWTNAGVTRGRMDKAIAKARKEASEPIVYLPSYVAHVLATMDAPPKQPRQTPEERRRAISEANAAAFLAGVPTDDPNVIDMEH